MLLAPSTYRSIVKAKIYIDENFNGEICLDDISREALMSRFHFHRLFRQVYHFTPHQYVTKKRLDKAQVLLSENRPVTEVCNEVGFESVGSFSTLFKKEVGYAPAYYRNMAWLKKQQQMEEPKRAIPGCFVETYNM